MKECHWNRSRHFCEEKLECPEKKHIQNVADGDVLGLQVLQTFTKTLNTIEMKKASKHSIHIRNHTAINKHTHKSISSSST